MLQFIHQLLKVDQQPNYALHSSVLFYLEAKGWMSGDLLQELSCLLAGSFNIVSLLLRLVFALLNSLATKRRIQLAERVVVFLKGNQTLEALDQLRENSVCGR